MIPPRAFAWALVQTVRAVFLNGFLNRFVSEHFSKVRVPFLFVAGRNPVVAVGPVAITASRSEPRTPDALLVLGLVSRPTLHCKDLKRP